MACLDFKTSVIKRFDCYLSSTNFFVSLGDIFSKDAILTCVFLRGLFWRRYGFWYKLMVFPNQKMAFIFMIMILVFSIRTKTFAKLRLLWLKNSIHSVNCLLIISCRFILGKIMQSVFNFLKLNICQVRYGLRKLETVPYCRILRISSWF